MKLALLACVALLILAAGWVRLAPSDPARWHVFPDNADPRIPDYSTRNARLSHRSYPAPPSEVLARLDKTARATPRTTVLAGSIEDGMITYMSPAPRSGVFRTTQRRSHNPMTGAAPISSSTDAPATAQAISASTPNASRAG